MFEEKNVVNNVDMSSLRALWQNDPYTNQHTEQHKNTYNTKTQQTFRKKTETVFGHFYCWMSFDRNNFKFLTIIFYPKKGLSHT